MATIEMHCGMCEFDWQGGTGDRCPSCDSDETETVAQAVTHNRHFQSRYAHALGQLIALRIALRDLVERCDGAEGVREDGSNIDTLAAHAALGDMEEDVP